MSSARQHLRYKAAALDLLGHVAYAQCKYADARQFYGKSLALFQEIGFGMMVGEVSFQVGLAAFALGEYAEASEYYREALGWFRDADNAQKIATPLACLGDVALALGDVQQGRQHYRQALKSAASGSDVGVKLDVLVAQAELLARQGKNASSQERAAELLALVLDRHSHAPVRMNQEMVTGARRSLDELAVKLPPHVFAAAQERGRARDLDATLAELLAELQTD
jgi:tetratricopeptide (TPR) repeat protein